MTDLLKTISNQLSEYLTELIQLLPQIILALCILLFTLFVAKRIKRFTNTRVAKRAKDPLLASFIGELVRIAVIVIGVAIVLGIIKLNDVASKLVAGAGITAFIIGFAFRDIGENFLAGIIMAFKRPFQIGDVVETNGINGKILSMTMRETIVKTFDGKDVHIPNGLILKSPLFNYTTDALNRLEFTVRLPQAADLPKALSVIGNILKSSDGVLTENEPTVELNSISDGQANILVQFWVNDQQGNKPSTTIKSEVIEKTLSALRQEGFFGEQVK